MCIIMIKDRTPSPDPVILFNESYYNPHGLGVVWLDTYEVEYFESDEWRVLLEKPDRDYIAHFRYATVGHVSKKNTHPFEIKKGMYLFQNGTNKNLGSSKMTDTEHMARILSRVPEKLYRDILEVTDSRYVIVDTNKKEYTIYNWASWEFDEYGNMYSKQPDSFPYYDAIEDYATSEDQKYLPQAMPGDADSQGYYFGHLDGDCTDDVLKNDFLAVYGTLKKGRGNNHLLDNDCFEFVGKGKTVQKYPMIAYGVPFVSEKPGHGYNIEVEVYRILDVKGMADVDSLESHPSWYVRKTTSIELEDGEQIAAWLYFNDYALSYSPNDYVSKY